ncbi:MAG: serine hydrolase [Candidatus Aminicenantales bacterium]
MKTKIKALFFISILILGLVYSGASTELNLLRQSSDPEFLPEFDNFVARQMALDRIPGLSVAFMRGGLIWAKGYGYSDLENMVPAGPESSYRLASITKTITAVAVLQLVEAGKIHLDAEVQTSVPYFPRKKWPVTVRQLLGHLGGISHYKNDALEGHIKEPKNTKQSLAIFQNFDLVAEPGTNFNYSSYGFNLLGAVIEEASGESYGDYIKKHIFDPLGMENSRMDSPVDLIPNRVRGYRILEDELKNSEYVDVSSRFAGGGARSAVVDLMKYAQGIMKGELLKEDTSQQMFSSLALRSGHFTGYGMGWMVRPWKGHFQGSHGGSQPETRTHLIIFPAENFALAVAANLENVNLMPYVKRLAELALEEDMDGSAYVSDRNMQLLSNACEWTFSYGLSSYDWNGKILSRSQKDLEQAFAYFHSCVNEKFAQKDYGEAKKKTTAGIHPVSNQAFTQVGSFMASTLKEAFGEEKLRIYNQTGPTAFFRDYIQVSKVRPGIKKAFRFPKSFERMIEKWDRQWKAAYTEYVRGLTITPGTDFNEVEANLKNAFAGASFYMDFSEDMASAAQSYLEKNDPVKTFRILYICRDLYPVSPVPYASLGEAHIRTGNTDAARENYNKAFSLDPDHTLVSLSRLNALRNRLARAKKWKERLALGLITLDFYPREANLAVEVGNMFLLAGEKEKAAEFYRKALEINPGLESAKIKLKEIEKNK